MKFVLVESSTANIVSRIESNDVGEAENYFRGVKNMPEDKDFKRLWKVMSEKDYDSQRDLSLRQSGGHTRQYEWWRDDESYLDIDK